jgi:hypothetical protein
MDRRRRSRIDAGLVALAAIGALAGCSAITEGGANDTLAPLPPPGQGAIVTQAPLPPAETSAATTSAPGTVADDDSDPTSVAGRYLNAVATNNAAAAAALQTGETDPNTFTWAVATYETTVSVAGDGAWGSPSCAAPAGTTVRCTWMQNDPGTSLVLVSDGTSWRVSHPLAVPASGPPASIGQACIVGDKGVNFRGGPGTGWPRFEQLPPGTCMSVLDATVTDSEGAWRLVDADGRLGWLVERVLRFQ